MVFRFATLGVASLTRDGTPLEGSASGRLPLALLAILARAGSAGQSRDRIAALLWPESDTERARNSLRQTVFTIRSVLGREAITGTDELRLNPAIVNTDLNDYAAAVARRDATEALRLYAGPFLDGFHLRDSKEFEDWVDVQREQLRTVHAGLLEWSAEAAEKNGDWNEASHLWRARFSLDRLAGRHVLRLMRALRAAGDRSGAIQVGRVHRTLVRNELGTDADPEVLALLDEMQSAPADRARELRVPDSTAAGPAVFEAHAELNPAPSETVRTADTMRSDLSADGNAAEGRPGRPRRRGVRLVVSAAAAVLVLWGGSRLAQGLPADGAAAAGDEDVVVIFPFTVIGDSSSAFLGTAVVELLSSSLDGADGLRGVDGRAVLAHVQREDVPRGPAPAAHEARRLGGNLFVLGSIVAHGQQLRLVAALYDRGAPDAPIANVNVVGSTADPFAAIDQLAGLLLARRFPEGRQPLARTAALTTDLPALKFFLEAERALREGDIQPAVTAYGRAIDQDSMFALAYYRLAILALYNDVGPANPDSLMDLAHRWADRLPIRYRSAVTALRARVRNDSDAEAMLREHLTRYPDDSDAWFQLGDVMLHNNPLHGRPVAQAEHALEQAVSIDPKNVLALNHLFELRMLSGQHAAAENLLPLIPSDHSPSLTSRILAEGARSGANLSPELIAMLSPPSGGIDRSAMLDVIALTDELDLGLRLWRWRLGALPAGRFRGGANRVVSWILLTSGRIEEARSTLSELEREEGAPAPLERILMAAMPWIPAERAELLRARELCETWDLRAYFNEGPGAPEAAARGQTFLLGVLAERLGDEREADLRSTSLRQAGPDSVGRAHGLELAAILDAWRAARRGDRGTARKLLAGMRPADPLPGVGNVSRLERYLYAEALEGAGQYASAAAWYRGMREEYTTTRAMVYRVPSLLGEARALEAAGAGRKDEARAMRARAASLWRDADPALRLLVETKTR